ncbi:MAG TPA: TonB-dependent receptor, partial [Halothiobacillus sp.]|nr:TonB-dependent receptor [Halothiobacillus sp.]
YGAPIGQDSGFMVLFDHRQDEGHGRLPQKARIDSLLLKANTRLNEALSLEGSVGWDEQRVERARAPAPGQERYERKYDTLSGALGLTWSQEQHHWHTTANWERQDVMTDVRSRTEGDYGNLALESVYTFYGDQHWITVGGEARRDTVDLLTTRQGREVSGIKATIRNYALFAQDEIRLLNDRLTVIPGARVEHHSRFGSSFNPHLSAMLELADGTNLRASVGRSFKSPTIWQLYRDRPLLHGNREYLESNPDLDPETAWSANLGIEKRWQTLPLWTSANLFGSRVSDMIITVDTNREINGLPVRTYDNVDKVNIRGGELAFQLGDYNGLYLKGSGGVTRSTQKSGPFDGKQLTYVPRYQLNLAPGYVSDSGRWGTQLTWSKVGRQYRDRNNKFEIKDHQVVDASAWLMLSTGRLAPKLSLDLGNLTDSDKGETQANRYRTGCSIKLSLSGEF